MEKKQTAMQMAIGHFKSINYDMVNVPIQNVPYILEQFLSTEREQIEEAFVAGDERGTKDTPFNAEQYYTQTFKL